MADERTDGPKLEAWEDRSRKLAGYTRTCNKAKHTKGQWWWWWEQFSITEIARPRVIREENILVTVIWVEFQLATQAIFGILEMEKASFVAKHKYELTHVSGLWAKLVLRFFFTIGRPL